MKAIIMRKKLLEFADEVIRGYSGDSYKVYSLEPVIGTVSWRAQFYCSECRSNFPALKIDLSTDLTDEEIIGRMRQHIDEHRQDAHLQ
jgi:hypothetical protein